MPAGRLGIVSIPGVYGGLLDKIPFGAAMTKGLTLRMGQTQVNRWTDSACLSQESRAGGGSMARHLLDTGSEVERKRVAQQASQSGAGPTACETFRILADLVTTSPGAATAAGIGYDLDDPIATLEDQSGLGVGCHWRGLVYWIYVTFYGAHPRYEDSVGELEVFAGGTRVMRLRVHQRPDDAEHLVHIDGVDSFTSGAWTDELWALVERLGNPANQAAASAQCERALKGVQMPGARRGGPSAFRRRFTQLIG